MRWGKLTCPDTKGTGLLYSGTAGGSHHYEGGGGNYQCLTSEPANFAFGVQREDAGYIYGAEFEMWGNIPPANLPLSNQNVACAVCYVSTRGAVVMIPGTYICPAGWTREYYGYLMSERHKNRRSSFECVDASPDILPRHEGDEEREGDDEGALFHHVEPRCGSLRCRLTKSSGKSRAPCAPAETVPRTNCKLSKTRILTLIKNYYQMVLCRTNCQWF